MNLLHPPGGHTIIILSLLILLICIPVCCGGNNDATLGEKMIEGGIRQTIISLANDIYSLGVTDSADSSVMIKMAAYTVDPYKIPAVNEMNLVITNLFVCVFIVMIFGHGAVIMITQYRPEKLDGMELVTVDFNGYHYDEYVTKMVKGIFILALAHFSIEFILDLAHWLTLELLINIPGSIEPTPDNTILYGMMSLIWLSMLVFFIIRSYVIILFAAFALAVGALYIWGPTEQIAIMLWKYFLGLAFMQPIIVGVSCVVVRAIKESEGLCDLGTFGGVLDTGAEITQYLGLMVIIFGIAFFIIFAPFIQLLLLPLAKKVL